MNEPPYSPRSRITHGERGLKIFIPPSPGFGGWWSAVFGLPFLLVGVGFFVFGGTDESGQFRLDIVTRMALGFSCLAAGLLSMVEAFRGPTQICLEPEFLVVRSKLFGFSRTRKMDVGDVTSLRAYYTYSNDTGTHTEPGIVVDYRGRERRLSGTISKEEAEYLVAKIRRQYPHLWVLGAPDIFPPR